MLKITVTHICERCGKDKEVAVNINDANKTFRISDLFGEGVYYIIESKNVCKDCYDTYYKLIKKQKKELSEFTNRQEIV